MVTTNQLSCLISRSDTCGGDSFTCKQLYIVVIDCFGDGAPSSTVDLLPLKFLMTSFLAAPGLLLEKVPVLLVSPFAWCPAAPGRNPALLLLLEHEAAAAASSAIFTSSPMKSTESSNLNFFWMCSAVGEQQEEEEEEEEEFRVFGGEGEMVSAASSLSEPFIFLFFGDVMLPLSALTSAAAGLASWVGGGGGLGEEKPVGNMKKREFGFSAASLLDPKLPGSPEGRKSSSVSGGVKAPQPGAGGLVRLDETRQESPQLHLELAPSLSCYCWQQKKDGRLLLPLLASVLAPRRGLVRWEASARAAV